MGLWTLLIFDTIDDYNDTNNDWLYKKSLLSVIVLTWALNSKIRSLPKEKFDYI